MYNENRCYIYNKAFYEAYFNPKHNPDVKPTGHAIFDLIRNWAAGRGIYEGGNSHTQYVKLQEEAGALAKALLINDVREFIKEILNLISKYEQTPPINLFIQLPLLSHKSQLHNTLVLVIDCQFDIKIRDKIIKLFLHSSVKVSDVFF